jgi:MFS family permease
MAQNIFKKTKSEGADITSYMTIANFVGRVGWGFVSDKIGRKTFYLLATSAQAFALGLAVVWIRNNNFGAWLLSFLVVGTAYGGGFGVLPAFVSDLFGSKISAVSAWLARPQWWCWGLGHASCRGGCAGVAIAPPLPLPWLPQQAW